MWNEALMRRVLLVVVVAMLVASGFGIQKAYSRPLEVEEETVLLGYQHKGSFDYVARLKSAYLYDDIALEDSPYSTSAVASPSAPQAKPKYPCDLVQKADMSFAYSFTPDQDVTVQTAEQVEVKALIDRPGTAREERVLVPLTDAAGDFTVYFSFTGEELTAATTTITADVYTTVESLPDGPMFESFSQSLTITSKGPLLEISSPLTGSQRATFGGLSYQQAGEFGYVMNFKRDCVFGAIELGPPSTPPPPPPVPSATTVGPGEPLFTRLLDEVNVTFSYRFQPDKRAQNVTEEVVINAILENPNVWRKEFSLVPLTEKDGDFVVGFSLDGDDLSYFNDVYRVIERETGVSGPHTLTVKADVRTVAQTEQGAVVERFSQTLSTTLGRDVLEWGGDLNQSQAGSVRRSEIIPNPDKIMGLSAGWVRGLSILLTAIIVLALVYLVVLSVWLRPETVPPVEKEMLRAKKKHRDAIVDVTELPTVAARERVIKFGSLEELVKTADDMLKPVLHKADNGRHTYCVVDGSLRYEYISEI